MTKSGRVHEVGIQTFIASEKVRYISLHTVSLPWSISLILEVEKAKALAETMLEYIDLLEEDVSNQG